MSENVVKPRYFEFRNLPIWNNLFGVNIHFDCGKCGLSQSVRVPIRDYPIVECKHCKVLNKFNIMGSTYG